MANTDSEGRVRFTRYSVNRDPNGPILRKDHGYRGLRAPNGFIWGHSPNEFVYIPRVPSIPNYVTTWSRSMLKALGENYDRMEMEAMWEDPLVPPRVVRPWPVLHLPFGHPAQPDPPLGAIEEGCEWEHSDFMCYIIRADGPDGAEYDKDKGLAVHAQLVPRRCPARPSQECAGRVVINDNPDAVKNGQDLRQDFLWCEHFKSRLKAADKVERHRLIARAVAEMTIEGVVADPNGMHVMKRPLFLAQDGRPITPTVDPDTGSRGSGSSSGSLTPTPSDASGETVAPTGGEAVKNEAIAASDESLSDGALDLNAGGSSSAHHPALSKEPLVDVDRFSTDGLPKLEEFIPDGLLPDILLVHDPDRTTRHRQAASKPLKYKRVIYPLPSDAEVQATEAKAEERIAHLHLRKTNGLGSGHHSEVYSAPLTLPTPLSAHSRTGQVTVAAKLAFRHCTAHTLLHNEARVYARFPKHAQQEYCGYNIVPQCRFPVPVGPIMPKCYGFYLPAGEDGNVMWREEKGAAHSECSECEPCKVRWLSPILLMEECGAPIEPEKFTVDQRTECFSLVLRLHELHITQGSFYVRNIMIQPGPLSYPPADRTFDRPSFRIIDFGRARCLDLLLAGKEANERGRVVSDLQRALRDEEKQARDELLIEDCEF